VQGRGGVTLKTANCELPTAAGLNRQEGKSAEGLGHGGVVQIKLFTNKARIFIVHPEGAHFASEGSQPWAGDPSPRPSPSEIGRAANGFGMVCVGCVGKPTAGG
jgi:hypothetical protein